MKRSLTIGLATLAATASLVAGPAVRAVASLPYPASCIYEVPPGPGTQSVYFDGEGRLILNPEAVGDDAAAYREYLPEAVLALYGCVAERLPTGPAVCLYEKVIEIANSMDPLNSNLRYVYPNPNGPGYAVDYQLLISDALHPLGCV